MKKSYFRNIFNNYHNIGFGSLKTDVCLEQTVWSFQEELNMKLMPAKKKVLITEKRVHSLRAKSFFEKLREEADGLKNISFDCQKNLPLPKVSDQIAYYSRQLYFYNLTMVEGSSTQPFSKENVFSMCALKMSPAKI